MAEEFVRTLRVKYSIRPGSKVSGAAHAMSAFTISATAETINECLDALKKLAADAYNAFALVIFNRMYTIAHETLGIWESEAIMKEISKLAESEPKGAKFNLWPVSKSILTSLHKDLKDARDEALRTLLLVDKAKYDQYVRFVKLCEKYPRVSVHSLLASVGTHHKYLTESWYVEETARFLNMFFIPHSLVNKHLENLMKSWTPEFRPIFEYNIYEKKQQMLRREYLRRKERAGDYEFPLSPYLYAARFALGEIGEIPGKFEGPTGSLWKHIHYLMSDRGTEVGKLVGQIEAHLSSKKIPRDDKIRAVKIDMPFLILVTRSYPVLEAISRLHPEWRLRFQNHRQQLVSLLSRFAPSLPKIDSIISQVVKSAGTSLCNPKSVSNLLKGADIMFSFESCSEFASWLVEPDDSWVVPIGGMEGSWVGFKKVMQVVGGPLRSLYYEAFRSYNLFDIIVDNFSKLKYSNNFQFKDFVNAFAWLVGRGSKVALFATHPIVHLYAKVQLELYGSIKEVEKFKAAFMADTGENEKQATYYLSALAQGLNVKRSSRRVVKDFLDLVCRNALLFAYTIVYWICYRYLLSLLAPVGKWDVLQGARYVPVSIPSVSHEELVGSYARHYGAAKAAMVMVLEFIIQRTAPMVSLIEQAMQCKIDFKRTIDLFGFPTHLLHLSVKEKYRADFLRYLMSLVVDTEQMPSSARSLIDLSKRHHVRQQGDYLFPPEMSVAMFAVFFGLRAADRFKLSFGRRHLEIENVGMESLKSLVNWVNKVTSNTVINLYKCLEYFGQKRVLGSTEYSSREFLYKLTRMIAKSWGPSRRKFHNIARGHIVEMWSQAIRMFGMPYGIDIEELRKGFIRMLDHQIMSEPHKVLDALASGGKLTEVKLGEFVQNFLDNILLPKIMKESVAHYRDLMSWLANIFVYSARVECNAELFSYKKTIFGHLKLGGQTVWYPTDKVKFISGSKYLLHVYFLDAPFVRQAILGIPWSKFKKLNVGEVLKQFTGQRKVRSDVVVRTARVRVQKEVINKFPWLTQPMLDAFEVSRKTTSVIYKYARLYNTFSRIFGLDNSLVRFAYDLAQAADRVNKILFAPTVSTVAYLANRLIGRYLVSNFNLPYYRNVPSIFIRSLNIVISRDILSNMFLSGKDFPVAWPRWITDPRMIGFRFPEVAYEEVL